MCAAGNQTSAADKGGKPHSTACIRLLHTYIHAAYSVFETASASGSIRSGNAGYRYIRLVTEYIYSNHMLNHTCWIV